jgi:phosphoglycolate phosphatase-like HAD superfamily hydrolase
MAPERAFDLCIFDWNGTLRDDIRQIYECGVQRIFRHFGLPCPSLDDFRNEVGADYMTTFYWPRGIPRQATAEALKAIMRRGIAEEGESASLFPDALSTVLSLKRRGYRCVLASAYGQADLESEIEESGLAGAFEAVLGDVRDKNAAFAALIRGCHASPARTAAVGDTEEEAVAAVAVGAKPFICHRGVHTAARLAAAAARMPEMVIIDTLADLLVHLP